MRIAQIAPLMESVPPRVYGGTERIVSYLTEELVRRGHEVTLFATGDSRTAARLVPIVGRGLRLDDAVRDPMAYYAVLFDLLRRRADEFDILHFHIDYMHYPVFHAICRRTVTTLHGRQDLPDLQPLYTAFADMPMISISHDQRRPLPQANWVGNVYHGLPLNLYPFSIAPREPYLAFLGRFSPEKQPDHAIEISRRSGLALKMAAKIDKVDQAYFEARVKPRLGEPGIEFVGEIGDAEKAAFLGNAQALLFPIDWPEPFGLVMIEAMACGTPVIAYRRGSVPEVVDHGVSGFIVDGIDEAVAAVERAGRLDRAGVRRCFERRFSVGRMAADYIAIYRSMIEASPTRLGRRPAAPANIGRTARDSPLAVDGAALSGRA
jgi:glycosyltransferase involved in cell wall biosynthesis